MPGICCYKPNRELRCPVWWRLCRTTQPTTAFSRVLTEHRAVSHAVLYTRVITAVCTHMRGRPRCVVTMVSSQESALFPSPPWWSGVSPFCRWCTPGEQACERLCNAPVSTFHLTLGRLGLQMHATMSSFLNVLMFCLHRL